MKKGSWKHLSILKSHQLGRDPLAPSLASYLFFSSYSVRIVVKCDARRDAAAALIA